MSEVSWADGSGGEEMDQRGSSEGEVESAKEVEVHPRLTESRRKRDYPSKGRIRREERSL